MRNRFVGLVAFSLAPERGKVILILMKPNALPTKCYTFTMHDGSWCVAEVDLDEAGYRACGEYDSRDDAERAATWLNFKAGVRHWRQVEILKSAQRAQDARDAAEFSA